LYVGGHKLAPHHKNVVLKPLNVTVFKVLFSAVSIYFCEQFVHNLLIPRPLSEAGKRSFHYRGATARPIEAKNQTTLTFFKESLPANYYFHNVYLIKLYIFRIILLL